MQTHAAVQTDTEGEDAGVRPVMVDAESQCRGNSFPRVRRDEAQRLVDTAPDLAPEVERLRGYVHQLKLEDGERLAKVEELTKERRLSGWELQQQEEYIEDLRIASGCPSFSGADDASLRSTLRNMVVVHPACNEKHEQECQAAGHPIDMCECL